MTISHAIKCNDRESWATFRSNRKSDNKKLLRFGNFCTESHVSMHVAAGPTQYPYKSNGGYSSEPERNYDSDYSVKYKAVDRRHNPSTENANRYANDFSLISYENVYSRLCRIWNANMRNAFGNVVVSVEAIPLLEMPFRLLSHGKQFGKLLQCYQAFEMRILADEKLQKWRQKHCFSTQIAAYRLHSSASKLNWNLAKATIASVQKNEFVFSFSK